VRERRDVVFFLPSIIDRQAIVRLLVNMAKTLVKEVACAAVKPSPLVDLLGLQYDLSPSIFAGDVVQVFISDPRHHVPMKAIDNVRRMTEACLVKESFRVIHAGFLTNPWVHSTIDRSKPDHMIREPQYIRQASVSFRDVELSMTIGEMIGAKYFLIHLPVIVNDRKSFVKATRQLFDIVSRHPSINYIFETASSKPTVKTMKVVVSSQNESSEDPKEGSSEASHSIPTPVIVRGKEPIPRDAFSTDCVQRLVEMDAIFKSILHDRYSYCIDTAHIWALGENISTLDGLRKFRREIEDNGLKVDLFHLNGNSNLCGSLADKHEVCMSDRDRIWCECNDGLRETLNWIVEGKIPTILERDAAVAIREKERLIEWYEGMRDRAK
jgi:hypothetical protein